MHSTKTKREQRWYLEGFKFRDTEFVHGTEVSSCSDVTMSCDCHMAIPDNIASIVVALVAMYMCVCGTRLA